ncbi:MAG: putative toxin-antitoxin system toxin component, PIN family [Pyrinomonadaceae bacterium]
MISAVFDTNVMLQGILSTEGPAGACIDMLSEDKFRLVTSEAIIDEIRSVINRPKLIAKYSALRGEQPIRVFNKICSKAILVEHPEQKFRLDRDPSDEIFINLAITTGAEFIVSRDRDLLDLMDDSEFCNKFPKLRIVTPVGFLEIVRVA